jgi:hypothetical protein
MGLTLLAVRRRQGPGGSVPSAGQAHDQALATSVGTWPGRSRSASIAPRSSCRCPCGISRHRTLSDIEWQIQHVPRRHRCVAMVRVYTSRADVFADHAGEGLL